MVKHTKRSERVSASQFSVLRVHIKFRSEKSMNNQPSIFTNTMDLPHTIIKGLTTSLESPSTTALSKDVSIFAKVHYYELIDK
ncbi:hypothetical protein L484_002478 [Morus notabilis]|uniref:Uncharacterized protein n=1 Tax=Morus notabilis TaxID=981085 RepID=W9QIL0_9ROSA|nr:hypothetical protein L484_002478 [Morus notabilis]